jgi:hypothetical protein
MGWDLRRLKGVCFWQRKVCCKSGDASPVSILSREEKEEMEEF